ncbi:MAG: hypothetical protein LKJ11_04310 [Lactobacillus sp.]|nr:hypothetical protein [Lactobacillus sp.]
MGASLIGLMGIGAAASRKKRRHQAK